MDIVIAKYHLHPIFDHFTIALLAMGILADLVGYLVDSLFGDASPRAAGLAGRLCATAPVLLIPGAIFAILSRFTGESEAERVWDTISPAAQQILLSDTGLRWFLSHAVLGTYLMYAFSALATWRLMVEIWPRLRNAQLVYFAVTIIAFCALLYQGTTGGELVYNHGAGTSRGQITSRLDVEWPSRNRTWTRMRERPTSSCETESAVDSRHTGNLSACLINYTSHLQLRVNRSSTPAKLSTENRFNP
jgi:uncharacterized membrane protein